jgi:hypothetical protein
VLHVDDFLAEAKIHAVEEGLVDVLPQLSQRVLRVVRLDVQQVQVVAEVNQLLLR